MKYKYKLYTWAPDGDPYSKVSRAFVLHMGGEDAFNLVDAAGRYIILESPSVELTHLKLKYPFLSTYRTYQ